ncbi:hypothetical protein LCGC14_3026810 [marine sediment metagenome]|uniref:Uncharacterized protein n=1 Tax=marine sediment metagenome TaxID=412755 RepID=A0A0F8WTY8_9ZZZZ
MVMQKLTITIETTAEISKEDLTALGAAASDFIRVALKPYWHGATTQSSKIEVTRDNCPSQN